MKQIALRFTTLLLLITITSATSLELHSYYVECDPDEFEYIIEHPGENLYIDCTFEYNDSTWRDARIRLRGEASRYYPKKSFKVNFDPDDRFFNRDKLNLVSEYLDTSFCNEYLAYDLYRRAGLFASRAWFTRLYVNGEYLGLYLDIEQIDEHYLRYGDLSRSSSIYKADVPGCLLRPTDPIEDVWEKETNLETGPDDLLNLIEWLDTTPDQRFFSELTNYFNREELARVIAVNGLLGNSSTYYHNYYLIHELVEDGRWKMLPWDMDYTFDFRYDYIIPRFYLSGLDSEGTNKLIVNCWRNPDMRELIFRHITGLMDIIFVESYFSAMSDTLSDLLYDAVDDDPFKQFTVQQFLNRLALFPDLISGRNECVRQMMQEYPVPFDLKPAILTPDGVYFSWDSTFILNGADVEYKFQIDDDDDFSARDISDIEEPRLFLDDIPDGEVWYWRVIARSPENDRTHPLSFYSQIEIPDSAFDATVLTDPVESSVTWTIDDSPYSLPEGITIESDAVLTIEPGVRIGMGSDAHIRIEGGLLAIGTSEDSISFVPLNPANGWNSIELLNPSDDMIMSYVSIYGADNPIYSENGNIEIYDSHIRHGQCAIEAVNTDIHLERTLLDDYNRELIKAEGGTTTLRSCRFSSGILDGEVGNLVELDAVSEVEVIRCSFFNCSDNALYLSDFQRGHIINNRIIGADNTGVSIYGADYSMYIGSNIITDCEIGISCPSNVPIGLYNNVIAFNTEGLQVRYEEGRHRGVLVRNNILWRNEVELNLVGDVEIDAAYCLIRGDTLFPGEGNHFSDANFVDQFGYNFNLRQDSPLIDAGYGTNHPPFDYRDGARVDVPFVENTGSGDIPFVDIGAYEYGSIPVGVSDSKKPPDTHLLLKCYPNPFNSVIKIEFVITRHSFAHIKIFDVSGRMVFQRNIERAGPGLHSILWDGHNFNGMRLASGLYFCQIKQLTDISIIKIIYLN
ncbi:MAG: CotH kinase family protein [Candidatus Hatepunaea meridiana]|nr:CotH kinase family protein [Candidatus Hatepunaea meridiana]